ncbi:MAG: aminotransferase class V-fold PLP-dependent enzyme [Acidimicrobiales bacterium]|jgi:selenocysteine lyase/cysteine desulfurase
MPTVLDVAAERAATPGCATVAHLNNAGAALPTAATLDTIAEHLRLEATMGGYEAEAAEADRIAAVRVSAARLLGADPTEVAVTGSDTDGWTRALWGFALGGGLDGGRRILVDRQSYDSHYIGLLQVCAMTGSSIAAVPAAADGTMDLDALDAALVSGDVALVTATHVGTHRGLVNPVEQIGGRCRAAGVPLFLDACQSVGQLPVDVGRIGCAVATATGRKWLRGPRGTGLLYVRSDLVGMFRPPGVDGSSAQWDDADHYQLRPGMARFVPFESPVAMYLGLGTAIDHTLDLGIDAIAEQVGAVAEHLRGGLAAVDGVGVHDGGSVRSGIVTFTVDGVAPATVKAAAAAAGVNVSVAGSGAARLDMGGDRPDEVVRASPHYINTEDECARLVDVVAGLIPG